MDWWKKVIVPAQYKMFAASYRFGFEHGATGVKAHSRHYFSNDEAFAAYSAGYEAGKAKAVAVPDGVLL